MIVLEPNAYPQRARIGSRIRTARLARRLTIKQVAESCGVTEGFLSRLERDLTSPSVATLITLCAVLSIDAGDLLSHVEASHVSLADAPRVASSSENVHERLLTPRKESRIQVIHAELDAGAQGNSAYYDVNAPVHYVHVLDGRLYVQLQDQEWELETSDSLTFSGKDPHDWKADTVLGATVLWFLSPATGE